MGDLRSSGASDARGTMDRRAALAAIGGSGAAVALLMAASEAQARQGKGRSPGLDIDATEQLLTRSVKRLARDHSLGVPLPMHDEMEVVLEYLVRSGCLLVQGFNHRLRRGVQLGTSARDWASTPRRLPGAGGADRGFPGGQLGPLGPDREPSDLFAPIPVFEDFYPFDDLFEDLDKDLGVFIDLGEETQDGWVVQASRGGALTQDEGVPIAMKLSGVAPTAVRVWIDNDSANQAVATQTGQRYWGVARVPSASPSELKVQVTAGATERVFTFALNP